MLQNQTHWPGFVGTEVHMDTSKMATFNLAGNRANAPNVVINSTVADAAAVGDSFGPNARRAERPDSGATLDIPSLRGTPRSPSFFAKSYK